MQPYSRKDRYSHRKTITALVAAGMLSLGASAVSPTGQGVSSKDNTLRGQSNTNSTGQPLTARMEDEREAEDLT